MINLQSKTNCLKIGSSVSINIIKLWTKFSKKGLLLDQEKVTRVDCSLNAVRNTCIVRPRYLVITEIKLKLKGKQKQIQTNHKATLHGWDAKHSHMRKLFFANLYQTCSFVENRRNVHKTHTVSFYYNTNKYDKSKLETEEHCRWLFHLYIYTITCIYERTL